MRPLLFCLLAGAWFCPGPLNGAEGDPGPIPVPDEAKAASLAWLKLVDDGKFAESWKEAATFFQTMVTEQRWTTVMSRTREPLGAVSKREFKSAEFTHVVPRSPKGDYWIIHYAANFEGTDALETITAMLDKDGKWHISGYAIKPAS